MISDGFIPRRQRLHISISLIGASLLFIFLPTFVLNDFLFYSRHFHNGVLPKKLCILILLIVFLGILLGNYLYKYLIKMNPPKRRRTFLLISIISNLSILGFFKYFNFFLESLVSLLNQFSLNLSASRFNIILPVGISFYTFMTMTYTIDIFKNRLKPTQKLADYALYVSFFPKILAGPIERASSFLPQINQERQVNKEDIKFGLHDIFMGFFKKIAIADGVAQSVNYAFAGTYQLSWADAVIGAFLFSIQIYCDFSGYSDIAIGTARLFGFNLIRNFNYPYFSRNPSQFWGRWHISLSSWFRDYVFFPLGGPYGKTVKWLRNILITFFLTGLWHGAAWTYILWGVYHGFLLSIHRLKESLIKKRRKHKSTVKKVFFISCFFILTTIGWIIFRASTVGQAFMYIKTIFINFGDFKINILLPHEITILGLLIFIAIEFLTYNSKGKRLNQILPIPVWTAVYAGMIFLIALSLSNVPTGFIYLTF